jgi:hypothetical protein
MTELSPLLLDAMRKEWEIAHAPWIRDRDPPSIGSYLTTCVNGDSKKYRAMHYWDKAWLSPGPFVTVVAWMNAPEVA